MSRTLTIRVYNRTSATLVFKNARGETGPAATANKKSVAPGDELKVTAYNKASPFGGNKGTFDLDSDDGLVYFTIFYNHPWDKGDTVVYAKKQKTGYVSGTDRADYEGDPAAAALSLYKGVAVTGADGKTAYCVPLGENPYYSNLTCQNFANSMFGPNMRAPSLVESAFSQTGVPFKPADFTGNQLQSRVVDALYRSWMDSDGIQGDDWRMLRFLRDFIVDKAKPSMVLWIPRIAYRANSSPAVFTLSGYEGAAFASNAGGKIAWSEKAVRNFLSLLAGGSHFVWISADDDFKKQNLTNPGRDLYYDFRRSSLAQRGDAFNSHYATVGNTTGQYYLNITSDFAPYGCELLLALLFGRTVNGLPTDKGNYNTFMQLEGWPAHGVTGGKRHGADYDAYKKSLWNISTYGASPYSEKRATTVFVAPPGWTPQIYKITRMMPYVGAYAHGKYPNGKPEGWLETSLVDLPSNAPDLPSKYYT